MKRGELLIVLLAMIVIAIGVTLVILKEKSKVTPIYRIFYVEEMPCIEIGSGISCDWSKWPE